MSTANKLKKPNEEESDSYDSDSSGADSEAYNENEVIQVEFEGRCPATSDFHGIRQMLYQLFLKSDINLSELADKITDQGNIGSVVIQSCGDEDEQDDDYEENAADADFNTSDTIFGITTAINISKSYSEGCIEGIRQYLLTKCATGTIDANRQSFANVLNDDTKKIGLIIHERFINIPAQIAVPLLENLAAEIDVACNSQKMEKFQFTHYVMIVKFNRKSGKGSKKGQIEDILTNDEEEILDEFADAKFEFSAANETDSTLSGNWTEKDATLTPHRKIILFEATKLSHIIHAITQFISG